MAEKRSSRIPKALSFLTKAVTKRKRVAAALRESEEFHRITLGNISDAVFITDDTGAFTYICPNVSVIFGHSFDEVRAFGNISRLLGDGVFDPTELESRGEIANIDREIRDKAGNNHALLVNVKRVPIKEGTRLYTCRDITERKQAQEVIRTANEELEGRVALRTAELEQRNAELRLLESMTRMIGEAEDFESALQIMLREVCESTGWDYGEAWVPRSDGEVLECRPVSYSPTEESERFRQASERIEWRPGFGLPGRVWLSKEPEWIEDVSSVSETVFARSRIAAEAGFKAAVAFPVMVSDEVVTVLLLLRLRSQARDQGHIHVLQSIATQLGTILRRRRADEALQKSEQLMRTTLESTEDGILVVDASGKILHANTRFAEQWRVPEVMIEPEASAEELRCLAADRLEDTRAFLSRLDELYQTPHAVFDTLTFTDGQVLERYSSPLMRGDEITGRVWSFRDVTERKQAARSLKSSEELMRTTLESTADGILIVDTNANVVHANARFAEIWDMPQEMIEAGNTEPMRRFAADQLEDPEGFVSRIQELYRSLNSSFDTVTFQDGRALERYSSPLMREEELIGRVWSFRDVTERKQAEAFLAEQTRALGALLKGAPLEEVLTTIVKMVEERARGMLCSILLLNKEEGMLRPGVAPSLPDSFNQAIAQGILIGPKAGSCGTAAYRAEPVISSDIATDPIWAEYVDLAISHELRACWSTPIFSSEREVLGTFAMYYHEPRSPGEAELRLIELATGFVGIAIERKRLEQARQESEERLLRLTENAQDIIFRYRFIPTPGYEYVNPAVTAITGYTPEEFLADPDLDVKIIHPDDRESLRQTIAQVVIAPEPLRWIRKDGAIVWMEHRHVPVYDEDGNLVAVEGIARDITEQKCLEEQLQSAREELEGKVERQILRRNPYGLTFREFTILHLVTVGRSDKEIATELVISPQTVHKHVANILAKMDAASRTEAATRALREGLLE